MIVGIAGTFAAGKDVAAEYLAETQKFLWVSTGDMVRKLSKELHGSIERSLLKQVADEARQEHGSGYFVQQALQQYALQKDQFHGVVVTGVRSIGEATTLKQADGTLLFVDAPQQLRYERSAKRQRGDREQSFEQFVQNEERELHPQERTDWVINISAVKNLADIYLINDTDLGSFLAQLDAHLFGR